MTGIRLTRELLAAGFADAELSRMTRAGDLRHLRRGAYALPSADAVDARVAHLELLEATLRQSSPDTVASHMTAAAVHGLPVWYDLLGRVQLTRDRAGGLRQRRYSIIRGLPLRDDEVVTVDGIQVTSLARTMVDLGCALTMQQAVAVGDAAMRAGLSRPEIAVALERARNRKGVGRARRSLEFLDPRSESPGESSSRVVFFEADLPAPDLQVRLRSIAGVVIARCDFGWEEHNTVGEFDGRVKYGRTLQPDKQIEDVLFEEKCREDLIREAGPQVARWIHRDLSAPVQLRQRLLRAFALGRQQARYGSGRGTWTPWPQADQ